MSKLIAINSYLAFLLPERASTVAEEHDWVFNFLVGLMVFFFVLVVSLMVLFVWRFRHRPGQPQRAAASAAANHGKHTALEITWTVIPTIIVVVIFYYGFTGYMRMAVAPPNSYEILVTSYMWNWEFTYPNGHISRELHVPVNTPVRLVLTSRDVIHGLYIPAFRIKKDAVPGRYNKLWFQATKTGTYEIQCSQYCGTSHSQMLSQVVVHEPGEFREWLQRESNVVANLPPLEAGRLLFAQRGCNTCHSVDGSRLIGPTMKNFFGYEQQYAGGARSPLDENAVREALFNPQAKILLGYDAVMPSFKGSLSDQEAGAIIAYLKSLSDKGGTEPLPAPPSGPATLPAQ